MSKFIRVNIFSTFYIKRSKDLDARGGMTETRDLCTVETMPVFICKIVQNAGSDIVPFTAIELEADDTFETLFDATIKRISTAYEKYTKGLVNIDDVCSIKIKENANGDVVEISKPDMSLGICLDLNRKFVEMKLKCSSEPPCSKQDKHKVDAFSRLMNASKTYSLPEKISGKREELKGPQRLFNDLIEWASNFDNGWSTQYMPSATKVLTCLRNALWYVDNSHDKFRESGCPIPKPFHKFSGYNNFK